VLSPVCGSQSGSHRGSHSNRPVEYDSELRSARPSCWWRRRLQAKALASAVEDDDGHIQADPYRIVVGCRGHPDQDHGRGVVLRARSAENSTSSRGLGRRVPILLSPVGEDVDGARCGEDRGADLAVRSGRQPISKSGAR
jgi:hypothetical protein